MRQPPVKPRWIALRGSRHATVLGTARRVRDRCRIEANDEDIPCITPRARGLQCFRASPVKAMPLGVRTSVLEGWGPPEVRSNVDAHPELPPPAPKPTVSSTSRSVTWADPSGLLARATGTARVLDALAGNGLEHLTPEVPTEPEHVTVDVNAAPPALVADEQDTTAFGPRLCLSLESCHTRSSRRLWDAFDGVDRVAPMGNRLSANDLIAAAVEPPDSPTTADTRSVDDTGPSPNADEPGDRYGCPDEPGAVILEEFALAERLGAAPSTPAPALTEEALSPTLWPETVVEPPANLMQETQWAWMSGLDCDVAPPEQPTPPAVAMAQATPEAPDQPKKPARPSPGDVDDEDDAERPAAQQRPPTSARRAARRFRFPWPRRRPMDPETARKKRTEMFRKALEQRPRWLERSATPSQRRSAKMTRPHVSWKPGDPFAGRSPKKGRGFRWHAMVLTAAGVATAGFAALWILSTAGLIAM